MHVTRPVPSNEVPAILVGIDFGAPYHRDYLAEAVELVSSAGAKVVQVISGKRAKPEAGTFAGQGKIQEIADAVTLHDAQLVVFNHQLSSAQLRNIERETKARVIDRTDLILEIFGQRARSAEGQLQVELAQTEHLLTRLVRAWSHLERQGGGTGARGGMGETQLEVDKRLVNVKIKQLKDRLKKVARQRETQRASRRKSKDLSVSIVGYTNAGKSTLFNRLTHSQTYVADQLFATLDTTTRKLYLNPSHNAAVSDTVGFIRELPHGLVAAFRATLEEAVNADVLLHVVDASNPMREQQIADVNAVLAEIGAENVPQLVVYNKLDAARAYYVQQSQKLQMPPLGQNLDSSFSANTLSDETECAQNAPHFMKILAPAGSLEAGAIYDQYGKVSAVRVSALTGEGFDALRMALLAVSEAHRDAETATTRLAANAEALDFDDFAATSHQ
jgi:GTPase